ncbi:MAG: hypothetical protein AB7Q17_07415 [Phycisphaerae bacterium]
MSDPASTAERGHDDATRSTPDKATAPQPAGSDAGRADAPAAPARSLARRVRSAAACFGLKARRRGGGLQLGKRLGLAAFVFFFAKGLVWLAIAAGSYAALVN